MNTAFYIRFFPQLVTAVTLARNTAIVTVTAASVSASLAMKGRNVTGVQPGSVRYPRDVCHVNATWLARCLVDAIR